MTADSLSKIDKVRASRDGHQFHEAWVARRALGLLLPRDSLCGIAVEGLGVEDQIGVANAVVEVADATFYFGKRPNFRDADTIEIAQFKYSVARADTPFRCADATKTIGKLFAAETDLPNKHGASILPKLRYAIYTNRPIAKEFLAALEALASGTEPTGKRAKDQYEQLTQIVSAESIERQVFAQRLSLHGAGGNLALVETTNVQIIADWSASNDLTVKARIGDLRELVRGKAGTQGQKNNLLTNVDVLAALGLSEEGQLLPTPGAFPDPGPIVERTQLRDFLGQLIEQGPWLVHAAGGIGKTVFIQSVASTLRQQGQAVVLFDCFGGGAYRSPLDGRHRPERGLMHIVNELACRGLCDPILPGSADSTEVVRKALQRFAQAIATLRRTRPGAKLFVILDAADNAAMEAEDRRQSAFPRLLFESLQYHDPIDGLIVLATARTERREIAVGTAAHKELQLPPFTVEETKQFVLARRSEATAPQIGALQRRSRGNPRIIANLIEPGQPLTASEDQIDLPELIQARIDRAVSLAGIKGATEAQVAAFLCALSILPPPVPFSELASAFGIEESGVESFAADLSPLLEGTRYGLIFRDEPTETLVRDTYGKRVELLDDVVVRLTATQSSSIYSARSLPSVLFAMRRTAELRSLAFDMRFPAQLSGDVAKRTIRLNRIRTALHSATAEGERGVCIELMIELATIVVGDERGESYLLANPDLTVGLGNSEDMRRLFEIRSGWPGRRHARLAIAYSVDGSLDEAHEQAVRVEKWLHWLDHQDDEERLHVDPGVDDHAAIAVYLLARGDAKRAVSYLASWAPYYSYLLAKRAFGYYASAAALGDPRDVTDMVTTLAKAKPPPSVAAALLAVFPEADDKLFHLAFAKLAKRLKAKVSFPDDFDSRRSDNFLRALVRCALRMSRIGLKDDAGHILNVAAPQRFDLWSLRDDWHFAEVVDWLMYAVAGCASDSRQPDLFDCLPRSLWALVEDDPRPATDAERMALLEQRFKEDSELKKGTEQKAKVSSTDRHNAMENVRKRVQPMLELARLAYAAVVATPETSDRELNNFCEGWQKALETSKQRDGYLARDQRRYLDALYRGATAELLDALGGCTPQAAGALVNSLDHADIRPPTAAIGFVRVLARRAETHALAGKVAVLAVRWIEAEDDVAHRTLLFAELARAQLPASKEEAATIFARGVSELDALGSGDYDFAWELLHFAARIENGPLPPDLVLRLAKICEISMYDSHKWPWPLTAQAFVKISGPSFLAQLCRWHDRDKVDLSLTLPSTITELIEAKAISPKDGLPLLRLVVPVPMWDWNWHNLLSAVLGHPEHSLDDVLDIFDQFELVFPEAPPKHYLGEIEAVLAKFPAVEAALSPRIKALHERRTCPRTLQKADGNHRLRRSPNTTLRSQEIPASIVGALRKADPLNTKSIEEFLEFLGTLDQLPTGQHELLGRLRVRVPYPDRGHHVEALLSARNLDFFDKTSALQAARDEWLTDSPGGLPQFKGVGTRLVRDHADHILGKDWGGPLRDLQKAASLSGEPADELAVTLVNAAIELEIEPSAAAWLSIASAVARNTPPGPAKAALERLLSSGAARLVDETGDGPWNAALDAGADREEMLAKITWHMLGSPETSARWRAAHVVRHFAINGRWAVIDKLFDCIHAKDAGAFQDRSLPFFQMDATLWFLLAVARIAIDHPEEIARHAGTLKAIALDHKFPHVGYQEVARAALVAIGGGKPLSGKLAQINRPQLRPVDRRNSVPDFPWDRPRDQPKPEPRFYFEYEFEKYEMARLGEVFGLPKWRIGDLMRAWIVQWSPGVDSMNAFSGKRQPNTRDQYYQANPSHHSHGSYLAWHALALVGGNLLRERPITADSYRDDPWREWLSTFQVTRDDGRWIADGTGRSPLQALHELRAAGKNDNERPPTHDAPFLLNIIGLGGEAATGRDLIVNAFWKSPDGVTFHVSSVLVPPGAADIAGSAVVTAPPYHVWLPTLEYDDDNGYERGDFRPCETWLASLESYEKLDREDPLGSHSAVAISRPAKRIIDRFGLVAADPWSHQWLGPDNSRAFAYQAWGGMRGEAERANRASSHLLVCDSRFLKKALTSMKRELLVLIKLERFHDRKKHADGTEEESKFTYTYVAARVDSDLKVSVIRPTSKDRAAVRKLDQYSKPDFTARYRAIQAANKGTD